MWLRRPGVGHGVLLPLGHPCRAHVRQDPALARGRRGRLCRRHRLQRGVLRTQEQAPRGSHRALEDHARRIPLPEEQVLPRRPLRERHRPRRRPPDRQGDQLVQPARHRRRRERRRHRRPPGRCLGLRQHRPEGRRRSCRRSRLDRRGDRSRPPTHPIRQGQSVRRAALRRRRCRCHRPRPRQRELKATQPWNHSLIRTGC